MGVNKFLKLPFAVGLSIKSVSFISTLFLFLMWRPFNLIFIIIHHLENLQIVILPGRRLYPLAALVLALLGFLYSEIPLELFLLPALLALVPPLIREPTQEILLQQFPV